MAVRLTVAILAAAAVGLAVVPAVPASKPEAKLVIDATTFAYTAPAGQLNAVTLVQNGNRVTLTDPGVVGDIKTSGTGDCHDISHVSVACTLPVHATISVDTGDLDDSIDAADVQRTTALSGGAGDDSFRGGSGADRISGGSGHDTVDYAASRQRVTVTIGNDLGDDGQAGEGDEVRSDVEAVIGTPYADALSAGWSPATLDGRGGDDTLQGGPGADELIGGDGDDSITSRDANLEAVACGAGADRLDADERDTATDCEQIVRGAPPAAPEDVSSVLDPTGRPEVGDELAGDVRPQRGRSVVAEPGAGTVKVRRKGAAHFRTLGAGAAIPVGSTIDVRHGSVTLSAAVDRHGRRVQRARFAGAVFSFGQTRRKHPTTVLRLRGGDFASCRAHAAGVAHASRKRKKPVRRLWGSGHGSFRTKGRQSAATVRGTVWLTEDRCDGTLTVVRRGVVDVRDRGLHRTFRVRAGHRHLSRVR
jgi:Ca2+-binding RTX toxin-like protein